MYKEISTNQFNNKATYNLSTYKAYMYNRLTNDCC